MQAHARNLSIIALTCVMAILLCLVQTASAVAAKSPEKTASGNFFADPNIYTGEIAPESQQPQWEIALAATPTASGRQVWLSADPLGEEGGLNLYGYVLGDPVNLWDPDGGSPAAIIAVVEAASGIVVGATEAIVGIADAALASVAAPWSTADEGLLLFADDAVKKLGKSKQVCGYTPKPLLKRPPLRKPLRDQVDASGRTPDGKWVDGNTGEIFEGPKHRGHIYGRENRRLIKEGDSKGMNQQQFNDWVNSHPEWFQIETPANNLSHKFEKPGG